VQQPLKGLRISMLQQSGQDKISVMVDRKAGELDIPKELPQEPWHVIVQNAIHLGSRNEPLSQDLGTGS